MNFPGHNYLGLGNPVDIDDQIAREHDLAYESAGTNEHIRAADRQAIGAFSRDILGTGNWHSAVGAAGLASKYVVESVTGVLYPRMSRSRTARSSTDNDSGPAAKKSKLDNVEGNSSAAASGVDHIPVTNYKTGILKFNHHRLMWTCGYQFTHLTGKQDADEKNKQLVYKYGFATTPFTNVPVDIVPCYLFPAEFKNLPITQEVKRVVTSVVPFGFRTPFVTSSAQITNANSEQFVLGCTAMALNNKYQGVNCKYKWSSDNPMLPKEIHLHRPDDDDEWYGSTATGSKIDYSDIPCAFGNQLPLHSYYVQHYDNEVGKDTVPEIMNDLQIFTFTNNSSINPIIYEYRPQVCILKPVRAYPPLRKFNTKLGYDIKNSQISEMQFKANLSTGLKVNSVRPSYGSTVTVPYESYLEQAGFMSHGMFEYAGGFLPPSLQTGILLNNSYINDMSESHLQSTVCLWKFDTEIEIHYSFDLLQGNDTYCSPQGQSLGDKSFIALSADITNAYGYKAKLDGDMNESVTTHFIYRLKM